MYIYIYIRIYIREYGSTLYVGWHKKAMAAHTFQLLIRGTIAQQNIIWPCFIRMVSLWLTTFVGLQIIEWQVGRHRLLLFHTLFQTCHHFHQLL